MYIMAGSLDYNFMEQVCIIMLLCYCSYLVHIPLANCHPFTAFALAVLTSGQPLVDSR